MRCMREENIRDRRKNSSRRSRAHNLSNMAHNLRKRRGGADQKLGTVDDRHEDGVGGPCPRYGTVQSSSWSPQSATPFSCRLLDYALLSG